MNRLVGSLDFPACANGNDTWRGREAHGIMGILPVEPTTTETSGVSLSWGDELQAQMAEDLLL